MSDPISLRNIPLDSLKTAQLLSLQTGLSINDVFRLSLASGLLVEITKVAPQLDGTLGGWDGSLLAKALRRHLGSAIDLLLEYEEHPYQSLMKGRQDEHTSEGLSKVNSFQGIQMNSKHIEPSIGDDLDALGIGLSFSESLEG